MPLGERENKPERYISELLLGLATELICIFFFFGILVCFTFYHSSHCNVNSMGLRSLFSCSLVHLHCVAHFLVHSKSLLNIFQITKLSVEGVVRENQVSEV